MGCKPTKPRSNIGDNIKKPEECMLDNLEDIGREQFFWQYPQSKLPIRDISKKTEPHIEIGVENYLRPCLQRNIRGFCHSPEKYLFLCTTCKNREVGGGKFFGKRFVVGYIKKKGCRNTGDYLAVIGETYMVPFNNKLNYGSLGFNRSRGMQKFDKKDTKRLLRLIHSQRNIRVNCMKEMIAKEKDGRKKGKDIPIYDECLGSECEFRRNCLRRSYHESNVIAYRN